MAAPTGSPEVSRHATSPFGHVFGETFKARRWRLDDDVGSWEWNGADFRLGVLVVWRPWVRGFWLHVPGGRIGFLWWRRSARV